MNVWENVPLTADEKTELRELRALKAWHSPRYLELNRRAAVMASNAWRKEDVWGEV